MRINEQANDLSILVDNEAGNVPCVDEQTGIITLPTETTVGSYLSMDPAEIWGSRVKEMLGPEGYSIPTNGYKHCRSEEHTSELESRQYLVCRLLLEKNKIGS